MKKVLFPILVVVLALGLALPAAAHTEDDPFTTDLIAGGGNEASAIDVGEVQVWNDGDNLYVKYVVDAEGWCLTETHLHVAISMEAIPQRNGNPPPGQFDYKTEHDCVTEYTYTIPLSWLPCTNLFIAAHAVVQKLSDPITASFATGDGIDTVLFITEDPANPNYPLGYPEAYGNTATPSVVIQGTPAAYSGWPTVTGAQWISDSLLNPGSANSWRLFTRDFSIPSNATNISGTLHIDSDNAEEAKINDSPAAGLVYGTVYGAVIGQPQEWKRIQHWPVSSYLQPGPNMLEVMVRNYYWVPTPGMWNYTGLIYKMDYEYQLLFTETAWAAGTDFPGRNWAMYFEYTVQCPCDDPVLINGDFEAPVVTAGPKWDIFDSGTTGLGWTVEWHTNVPGSWDGWTRPDPAHLELHRGVNNWNPYEGYQYAELDTDWNDHIGTLNNEPASVKIYQDINTCSFRTYKITYAWSPRPGHGDNKLEVYWDGGLVASHSASNSTNQTIWTLETHTGLTVSSDTTRLMFVETGDNADSLGMFLDAVSVELEPL